MKARVMISIVVLIVCASCESVRQAAGSIGELEQVQQAVSKAVGTSSVSVNLNNGKYLFIGLVNTPLKDLPTEQKQAKALEVARLCYKTYPQATSLQQVNIAFVVQRSYLGVFHYTDASDTFSFMTSDLSEPESTDGGSRDH